MQTTHCLAAQPTSCARPRHARMAAPTLWQPLSSFRQHHPTVLPLHSCPRRNKHAAAPRRELCGLHSQPLRRHLEAPEAIPARSPGDLPPQLGTGRESSAADEASSSNGSEASSSDVVQIDLELPRRSMQVSFTCNICNGRTERLVNPVAWERGMVIAQCAHCEAWHKLADAANLVQEIRYADLENSDDE